MAIYNNQALQNSPYIALGQIKNFRDRVIEKYIFQHCGEEAKVNSIRDVIFGLLADSPRLCPTFATHSLEALGQAVMENRYLTINGRAVSLSGEREAPGDAPSDYKDRYFSETLIEEPIRCPQNHIFELNRAVVWAERAQQMCPVGENHSIGDLAVDVELQGDIAGFRTERKNQVQREQEIIDRQQIQHLRNEALAVQQQRQQQQFDSFTDATKINPWIMGASTGKILVKAGGRTLLVSLGKVFGEMITKEGTKEAGKALGKSFAKTIPFISFFFGVGLAIYRHTQGQHYRAFGEFTSGVAACIPGYGTAASVALDVSLATYDIHEVCAASKPGGGAVIPVVNLDLNRAYICLGIDLKDNPEPPQSLVLQKYNSLVLWVHSDRAAKIGQFNKQQLDEITAFLNLCKDEIYRQREWA